MAFFSLGRNGIRMTFLLSALQFSVKSGKIEHKNVKKYTG